jgi:hypothetical protein
MIGKKKHWFPDGKNQELRQAYYFNNLNNEGNPRNDSDVHQRALQSIVDGAKELRRCTEHTLHEILALLKDLAFRIDEEGMVALQREEPGAPQGWTKEQWSQFFRQVCFLDPWGSTTELDLPTEQEEKVMTEIQKMKEEISRLKEKLGKQDEENCTGTYPGAKRGLIIPPHRVYPKPVVPRMHEDILEPLRSLKIPQKPPRFQNSFGGSENVYRRQMMVLNFLATKGVNIRIEIDLVIAAIEGIAPRGSVVRTIVEKLVKGGLLESKIFSMEKPFHTSIHLVWLTADARDFCREVDWKVCESEWEKLNRCQGGADRREKNITIVIAAMHARLRGYGVTVFPEGEGKNVADLLLTDAGGNDLYVFIFLEDSSLDETIQKMKAVQGRVGVCTLETGGKEKLLQICRDNGIEHGLVTDLQFLIAGNGSDQSPMPITKITRDTAMWEGAW